MDITKDLSRRGYMHGICYTRKLYYDGQIWKRAKEIQVTRGLRNSNPFYEVGDQITVQWKELARGEVLSHHQCFKTDYITYAHAM